MRARSVAGAVLLLALGANGRENPERFVALGTATQTFARCPNGGKVDLEAAHRRFDSARPGINAPGAYDAQVRAALAAHGGVLIAYAGRRYHSRYLSTLTRNWREVEEPVTVEAIVPSLDPRGVFVEAPLWNRRARQFMTWSSPHDDEPVCR
jgi:hypothetical protein